MLTVDGSVGQDHHGGGTKLASETYSLQHAWPTIKCRPMIFRGRRIRRLVKLLQDCRQRTRPRNRHWISVRSRYFHRISSQQTESGGQI